MTSKIKSEGAVAGNQPILDEALQECAKAQEWQVLLNLKLSASSSYSDEEGFSANSELSKKLTSGEISFVQLKEELESLGKVYSKVTKRQRGRADERNKIPSKPEAGRVINSLAELNEALKNEACSENDWKNTKKTKQLIDTYLKIHTPAQVEIEGKALKKAADEIEALTQAIEHW